MNAFASPGERGETSVLIVEDEQLLATRVERSLREAGYAVAGIAATASEVESLVLAHPPDVALVDIRLRGKGEGLEIAEWLRVNSDVPVVYLAAHARDAALQHDAGAGLHGHVDEPFNVGEVKRALDAALYEHGLERHLAERERWFSTTLRAIVDGVAACDAEQQVTFLNAAAERMLGCSEADARGSTIGELLGGDPSAAAAVTQALQRGISAPFTLEVGRDAAGRALFIEGKVSPLVVGERALGAVAVLRDVTEQRRHDEQLALTDRLSSLGTLVASVAHEINNPLAYTLGNLGLARAELTVLSSQLAEPQLQSALDRVLRSLRDAEDGAGRVANTVKELRAFGRMEERGQRPVDLRACVDWALRLTSNQLLHQARLVTSLREVPSVLANELKLSQVVVNLLTNAVQALTGEREDNQIRVGTWTDEDGWGVIEVEDNGRGMQESVRLAAFEPFFTTKAAGHGTGLGLSICRTIVRSLGGEISVESTAGQGSRFRVRLPPCADGASRSEPASAETPPPPRLSSHPNRPTPRVLVIDDEPMIRTLATRVLSSYFEVTSADGVRAALTALNESQDYEAILCDLMLPGESGMDFFAVLRRLYPQLVQRVAFITGGAVTPDTSRFLETAARPVLNKPFDPISLAVFVEQLVLQTATPAAYRL